MFALVDAAQIDRERQHEEDDRRHDGGLAQHVAGLGAEGRLGHAAAKGRAHPAILGLLRQDDENQEQRNEDQDNREKGEEDAHVK